MPSLSPMRRRLAPALAVAVAALLATPGAARAQSTQTKGPRGDVTLDGVVSAADAQAILFAVVGLPVPAGYAPMPWGDVNGDGRVSALDAQIVLAHVVGLPTPGFAVGVEMSRVTAVAATPGAQALLPGNTAQVTVTVKDSAGTALTDRPVAFISSDTTIATVSATGVITAVRDGYVTVTALAEGVYSSVYVGVGAITSASCGIAGTVGTPHGGAVTTSQTWTRAASPHFVAADLLVDAGAVLTIEPGAGVCVAPNALLSFANGARLSALGTAALPISFSAADTAQYWRGFSFDGAPSDFSYLHGVRISHAGARQPTGPNGVVVARSSHRVSLDSARIRQSDTRALDLGAPGSIVRRTVIDTTRVQSDLALFSAIITRSATTLDSVTVRATAGFGVSAFAPSLTMTDVTVDGAGGPGLSSEMNAIAAATRIVVRNTRFPYQGAVDGLAIIAPTPVEQANLLGNQVDTALVLGGWLRGRTLSLSRTLPVQVERGFPIDSGGVLVMRNGASLAFGDTIGISVMAGGRLDARGTLTDSVRFTAIDTTKNWGPIIFTGQGPADTSVVRYAKVEFGGVKLPVGVTNSRGNLDAAFEADNGFVTIDSSSFRKYGGLGVVLFGPNTVLRKVTLDSGITAGIAAVYAGYGATVEDVSVTRASDAGFWFETGAAPADGVTLRGAISVDGASLPGRAAIEFRGPTRTNVSNTATITVKNAKGYPVGVAAAMLGAIVKDSAAQARFLGNGNLVDTILVRAGTVKRDTVSFASPLAWRMVGSVTFDTASMMLVRPGTRMVFADSQGVFVKGGARIVARGEPARPILMDPSNPAAFWRGLDLAGVAGMDSSYLTNLVVSRAGRLGTAIIAPSLPLVMDSIRVRQSFLNAVSFGGPGSRLSRSVIDTTLGTTSGYGVQTTGAVLVESDTIRGSSGTGLLTVNSGVRIHGGAIIGSGSWGFFPNNVLRTAVADDFIAPRITGGASYPIGAAVSGLRVIARDSAMLAMYTGNARDTVDVFSTYAVLDTIALNPGMPYRFRGSVAVDTNAIMLIRPGTRIAVADSGSISARGGARIVARGTAARPIVIGPLNPAAYWAAVNVSGTPAADSSYLVNVRLERGGRFGNTINGQPGHPLVLDSIRVSQSLQNGITLNANGSRLSRSVVDTSGLVTGYAVSTSNSVLIEADTIRGARGTGLMVGTGATRIIGGAILGSGGVGLQVNTNAVSALPAFVAPRITGGASYPLSLFATQLKTSVRDSVMLARYTGNAKDTIDVKYGAVFRDTIPFNPGMPYRSTGFTADTNSLILVRPGARLALADSSYIVGRNGGRIDARGTASAPIQLTSLNPAGYWSDIALEGAPFDSSYFSYALIERGGGGYATIGADPTHPVLITNTRIRQSLKRALNFNGPARFENSVVDTTGAGVPAVTFNGASSMLYNSVIRGAAGTGLQLYSGGHSILQSTITGAGDDLVNITTGASTQSFSGLNLVGYGLKGTGGVAVRNTDTGGTATLSGTWWGSVSGKPAGSTIGLVTTVSDNTNSANPVTPSTP